MSTHITSSRLTASLARVWLTLAVTVLTAAVSIAGLLDERLLHALRRDGSAISAGQAWRLVSALLVQDGGVPGTLFNLLGLLVIGVVAEQTLSRRAWLVAYLAGGLTGELIGWTGWQPLGAGNSVAVCGLAGVLVVRLGRDRPVDQLASIACVAWATALLAGTLTVAAPIVATVATRVVAARVGVRRGRTVAAILTLVACVVLLVKSDIHGSALATGLILGAFMRRG